MAKGDRFYLIVNLKTAQILGLTLSPVLLLWADEVIERVITVGTGKDALTRFPYRDLRYLVEVIVICSQVCNTKYLHVCQEGSIVGEQFVYD